MKPNLLYTDRATHAHYAEFSDVVVSKYLSVRDLFRMHMGS